jgi:hypothetical protein
MRSPLQRTRVYSDLRLKIENVASGTSVTQTLIKLEAKGLEPPTVIDPRSTPMNRAVTACT